MKQKIFLFIIPTILLPYLILFSIATVFLSTSVPLFTFIMETIFRGNALYLLAAILLYCLISAVLGIICFIAVLKENLDALLLSKRIMIVKLIQIPAYVVIFVLGVLLALTIFTYPVSFALFLLDCLTVFLTGLLVTAAAINSVRQGAFQCKHIIWIIVLQFIFCADVIASVLFYRMLNSKHQADSNTP